MNHHPYAYLTAVVTVPLLFGRWDRAVSMNVHGSNGGAKKKVARGISDVNVVMYLLTAAFGAIAFVLPLFVAGAISALRFPSSGAVEVFIHLATVAIVPALVGRDALDTDFAPCGYGMRLNV